MTASVSRWVSVGMNAAIRSRHGTNHAVTAAAIVTASAPALPIQLQVPRVARGRHSHVRPDESSSEEVPGPSKGTGGRETCHDQERLRHGLEVLLHQDRDFRGTDPLPSPEVCMITPVTA